VQRIVRIGRYVVGGPAASAQFVEYTLHHCKQIMKHNTKERVGDDRASDNTQTIGVLRPARGLSPVCLGTEKSNVQSLEELHREQAFFSKDTYRNWYGDVVLKQISEVSRQS